jgi:predicted Zn-dependent protease
VHLMQLRTDEAITWLEKARRVDPADAPLQYFLASAYGLKGERDRVAAELAEGHRLMGSDRCSSIARVRANNPFEYREQPCE